MYLWEVSVIDRETEERIHLKVSGNTNEEATHKLTAAGFFGANGPYRWAGTGPLYDDHGKRIFAE
jgi:hypothetical protein